MPIRAGGATRLTVCPDDAVTNRRAAGIKNTSPTPRPAGWAELLHVPPGISGCCLPEGKARPECLVQESPAVPETDAGEHHAEQFAHGQGI